MSANKKPPRIIGGAWEPVWFAVTSPCASSKVQADGVICLPNQRVSKLIGEHTSLVEAFQITNGLVTQAVRGIWGLLSRPGLIRVDFADLCAVTQDRHAESCLASAEAQGENRSRDVTERLLAHPLLEEGALLSEASSVLVAIAGSRSLTLGEVNWIMERIRRQCEQAQLTLGAAIDEELGDRLVVTVVAARRSAGELPPGVRPDEAAAVGLTAEPEGPATGVRSAGRFVPPPPVLTAEKTEELFAQQNAAGARGRKGSSRLKQATLPLEILSRGRFEKSEPTLHGGQDLDVPTYLRRGVALN